MPRGRLLLLFLQGSKRFFLIGILTSLIVAGADMINPQLIRYTVDTVIDTEPSALPAFVNRLIDRIGGVPFLRENLWVLALVIIGVALFSAVSRYGQRLFNTKAAETLVQQMRNLLFTHIQKLPFSWHMKHQTGDIIQRCTSDVDTVKNFLSEQLTSILQIVLQVTLSLVLMFSMNVKLALVSVFTMPVILFYSSLFGKRIGSRFKDCDEAEGVLSAAAQENLTGVRVVRAFGREKYERDRFGKLNAAYRDLWLKLANLMAGFWGVGDFIAGVQIMLIIVLGTVFCVEGDMTPGAFIAFLSYNARLSWPIRRLGRMISELSKAGISLDRLGEILSSPAEEDKENACEPDLHGDIVFDDVTFAYDNCPELLHHVSFTAKAGSTVGILGGTGSGKSTLAQLIGGFYDATEGSVTVLGRDVKDYDASALCKFIGTVPQKSVLFRGSIRDNMQLGAKDATDEQIMEAISIAQAAEIVRDKGGLDYEISQGAKNLSGGQRQRLSIARALVLKPEILVFDDSSSALDFATEAALRRDLNKLPATTTKVIISQRAGTLTEADKILVLDDGRIVGIGTANELLGSCAVFREIYESQFGEKDGGKNEENQ